MKIGVSTACFYPMETELALERIGKLEIPQVEMFINTDSELSPAYLKKIGRRAGELGIGFLSLHPYTSGFEPFLFFSNYQRRFDDGREYYKRYYQAAGLLGARVVVFHGGRKTCPLPLEEYARRFALLCDDAKEQGVVLAHENVDRCIGSTPDFFRAMNELLPSPAYVLDVKQALRAGYSPYEMSKAMGAGAVHIHISDHKGERDCIPVGEGELDLERLKCTFVHTKEQSMVLELYRSSFTEDVQLSNSYKILTKSFFKQ